MLEKTKIYGKIREAAGILKARTMVDVQNFYLGKNKGKISKSVFLLNYANF